MKSAPDSSQIRAARGLLDWSQDDLARQAKVGICTVRRIEREGPDRMRASVTGPIAQALCDAGILFIPRGVRLKASAAVLKSSTGENL